MSFRLRYSSQHFVLKDTPTANSLPRMRCWDHPSRLHAETVYAFMNMRRSYRQQCFDRPVPSSELLMNFVLPLTNIHYMEDDRDSIPIKDLFPRIKLRSVSYPLFNLVGHHGLVLKHRGTLHSPYSSLGLEVTAQTGIQTVESGKEHPDSCRTKHISRTSKILTCILEEHSCDPSLHVALCTQAFERNPRWHR
jgi:hypothetical protein